MFRSVHVFLVLSCALWTAAAQAESISIEHAWARESPAVAEVGAGFMQMTNQGDQDDRLLAAHSDVSEQVELHTHEHRDGMMQMRRIDAIELPAGVPTELRPGGLHLMFIGLHAPLEAGQAFTVELEFEQSETQTVEFVVRDMRPGHTDHQGHANHGTHTDH